MGEKSFVDANFARLLKVAQAGSNEELGRLLESYRSYLLQIAHEEMSSRGLAKVNASDVVQDTFLEAHRDFTGFSGDSEGRLRGWLRQMLLHNIEDAYRRYMEAAKRRAGKEANLTASAAWHTLQQAPAPDPTPSRVVSEQERDVQLEQAIATLPDNYRTVILLRYRDDLSFEEIAARTDRSVDAVRKLWLRGVKRLQEILASEADNGHS